MTADDPARPEPALADVLDIVLELRREVDVLHAQVDDLTHLMLRLERQDRNQRRERR